MCECKKDIEGKLGDQYLYCDMLTETIMIPLYDRIKFSPEKRKGKPKSFFCSYCPFCGVKYPDGKV